MKKYQRRDILEIDSKILPVTKYLGKKKPDSNPVYLRKFTLYLVSFLVYSLEIFPVWEGALYVKV